MSNKPPDSFAGSSENGFSADMVVMQGKKCEGQKRKSGGLEGCATHPNTRLAG